MSDSLHKLLGEVGRISHRLRRWAQIRKLRNEPKHSTCGFTKRKHYFLLRHEWTLIHIKAELRMNAILNFHLKTRRA
jgi:hypothetical protein